MGDLVTSDISGGVATILFNRADAGNAISPDMIEAFTGTVRRLTSTDGVRAFLLMSEGKNFCVGGDIHTFTTSKDAQAHIRHVANVMHEGQALLAAHDAPVVVAVQGAAAGAGLSLATFGDIVVAAEDAFFAMAYTSIGLTADGGASWLLPRLVGLRVAQEMAFLGRRLSAQEALQLGLVTRLAAPDRLRDDASAIARQIAAGPTYAYGGVKRLFAQGDLSPFAEHLETEAISLSTAMTSEDAREGIAAFIERRPSVFKGR